MKKIFILTIAFIIIFSMCGYCRTVEVYLRKINPPIIIENVVASSSFETVYIVVSKDKDGKRIKYIFPYDILWQIIERE